MKLGQFYATLNNCTSPTSSSPLPEFQPPIPEFCLLPQNTTLSYIPSSPKLNYKIQFGIEDLKRVQDYQVVIEIDGINVFTLAHRSHCKEVATIRGKLEGGQIFPFQFAKIETTDDEKEAGKFIDKIGEISISFFKATYGEVQLISNSIAGTSKDRDEIIKIDETLAKFKYSELTTYDRKNPQELKAKTGVICLYVDKESSCTFIFKYRSSTLLDHLGISTIIEGMNLEPISLSISPSPFSSPEPFSSSHTQSKSHKSKLKTPIIQPQQQQPIISEHLSSIYSTSLTYFEIAKRKRDLEQKNKEKIEDKVEKPKSKKQKVDEVVKKKVVKVKEEEDDDLIIVEFNGVRE